MSIVDLQELKFILLDIEGTCSDINFVRNVLFPYSAQELRNFLSQNKHQPKVSEALKGLSSIDHEDQILELQSMIKNDVKHPSLKSLQGMIWKKGFESGEFKSPLYADVVPALDRWHRQGLRIGIYSSGSAPAQKLFWQFTEYGNLLKYFSAFFDLEIGSKMDKASYLDITSILELNAEDILFLSDSTAEVHAARLAGLKSLIIIRDGVPGPDSAPDFTQI